MGTGEQISVVVRDAKWIILAAIPFSLLFALQLQVPELYRTIYSTSPFASLEDFRGFLALHVSVLVVGLSLWLAAGQVTASTRHQISVPTNYFEHFATALPLFLGGLPLIFCAIGLFTTVPAALPDDDASVHIVMWKDLEEEVGALHFRLWVGVVVQIALTVSLVTCGWQLRDRAHQLADRLNKSLFGQPLGVIVTLAMIVAFTAAFYVMPVALPRMVGAFGVVALFAVCIVAYVTNFTLLRSRYRLPFIGLPLVLALVSLFSGVNNDHVVRLIDPPNPAMLMTADAQTAESQFSAWLDHRPDLKNYEGEGDQYPVYIVAAQGGGIYAAYQSAVFLARMQDACPVFRHHLFAISSVSGGSVGAAVFAAALNAYDRDLLELTEAEARQRAKSADGAFDPCPAITDYRTNPRLSAVIDSPGPVERAVRRALKQDFIAPIVAAGLFTDFVQHFLPAPVPSLDRTRSLEYALEQAGRDMMKPSATSGDAANHNVLADSFLNLWNPDRSIPALLINATEVASGRRVIISPFRTTVPPPPDAPSTPSMDFVFFDSKRRPPQGRDIRLSTAAFISARFPWITPGATIDTGPKPVRLVDGGYVDNTGIETALELHKAIAGAAQADRTKKARPQVNLIALTGGDGLPSDTWGEPSDFVEPFTALLSARNWSGAVMAEQARQNFPIYHIVDHYVFNYGAYSVQGHTFKNVKLDSRFYSLPLGWFLSENSRKIIERQSGQYWKCLPDSNFEQAEAGLNQSDCVQLLIYYELNKTWSGDSQRRISIQLAVSNYLIKKEKEERRSAGGDENRIIDCYQHATNGTVNLEQAGNIRALIQRWRIKYPGRGDLLAYVLGTAAFESVEFTAREQSLDFPSAEKILSTWGPSREELRQTSLADIERLYVHNPSALAEMVYGGKRGQMIGNVPDSGDAWLYRPRGLALVTGRKNYQKVADSERIPDLMINPDLLLVPELNAASFIDFYFSETNVPALADLISKKDWNGARAIVKENEREAPRALNAAELASAEKVREIAEIFGACIARANRNIKVQ
jgi:predicted chitinase